MIQFMYIPKDPMGLGSHSGSLQEGVEQIPHRVLPGRGRGLMHGGDGFYPGYVAAGGYTAGVGYGVWGGPYMVVRVSTVRSRSTVGVWPARTCCRRRFDTRSLILALYLAPSRSLTPSLSTSRAADIKHRT